ncbi:MAG: hypothetical protein ACRCYY_21310 [Trueperaceae bacterium]
MLGVQRLVKARAGFSSHTSVSLRSHVLPNVPRVRLLAGPQATPEALEALAKHTFTVGSLNRMGVRLEGGTVPGGEVISEATPPGVVQVPPSGQPIILLQDRGSIGGYAKPAVIDPRDLPLVAQLCPGQELRFIAPKRVDREVIG